MSHNDGFYVYNSTRRLVIVTISYVLIAAIMVALAWTRKDEIVLLVMAGLLALFLLAGAVFNIKKIIEHKPLFFFGDKGVTDLTKPDDIITLSWDQIIGAQLKSANNNDLMLDIVGYKTREELDEASITPEVEQQLSMSGGKVYYSLELSGMWVTRGRIKEVYEWLQNQAEQRGLSMEFHDFEDPIAKLGGGRENMERRVWVTPAKKYRDWKAREAAEKEASEKENGETEVTAAKSETAKPTSSAGSNTKRASEE